jgi:hypothetical protein
MSKLDEAVALEVMGWQKGDFGYWQDADGINQAPIKSVRDDYAYSPSTDPHSAKEVLAKLIAEGYAFWSLYKQEGDMRWREDGSNWAVGFKYAPNRPWTELYTVWNQPSQEMGICRAALRVKREQQNTTHPQEDWSDFQE